MAERGNLFRKLVFQTPREWLEYYATPIPLSGCWIFTRCLNEFGYGLVFANGKMRPAHRVSYEKFNGEIGAGLDVCHTCDVRCCIAPDHLWLGTKSQNRRDMLNKGREPAHMKPGYVKTLLSGEVTTP